MEMYRYGNDLAERLSTPEPAAYGEIRIYRPTYSAEHWPHSRAYETFEEDALTFAKLLQPIYLPEGAPLAAQVFGREAVKHRVSLEHLVNLLHERTKLHKRLLADITHRHFELQGNLFGANLHGKVDGYRGALRLKQMLLQLEEQKRREETDFWKDSMEIRSQLFERGMEDHALRHRMQLLESLEDAGGAYG